MKLTDEELQFGGRNTRHVSDDERRILDYECTPKSVARLVNSVKSEASWKQTAAMINVLNNCDIVPMGAMEALQESNGNGGQQSRVSKMTSKSKKSKPKKSKRKMSGWNCYLKKCSESGMSFQDCMSDKQRKEQKYVPKKDYWKEQAENGCK
jgi:hypothetical protein